MFLQKQIENEAKTLKTQSQLMDSNLVNNAEW